jgi:hypothetical protein
LFELRCGNALRRYARASEALGDATAANTDPRIETAWQKAAFARWLKADAECARLGISEVERVESVCRIGGAV